MRGLRRGWGCALAVAIACGPSQREVSGPAAATGGSPARAATATAPGDAAATVVDAAADEPVFAGPLLPSPPPLPRPEEAGACPEGAGVDPALGIMVAPESAAAGRPLRVLAATLADEAPLALRIEDGEGRALAVEITHRPGVPAAVIGEFTPTAAGALRVIVGPRWGRARLRFDQGAGVVAVAAGAARGWAGGVAAAARMERRGGGAVQRVAARALPRRPRRGAGVPLAGRGDARSRAEPAVRRAGVGMRTPRVRRWRW
jgi:hypothetical protein